MLCFDARVLIAVDVAQAVAAEGHCKGHFRQRTHHGAGWKQGGSGHFVSKGAGAAWQVVAWLAVAWLGVVWYSVAWGAWRTGM